MKIRWGLSVSALPCLFIGSGFVATTAWAQQSGRAAEQLQGHWEFESSEIVGSDGKRTAGSSQKGLFIFDPSGRYSIQLYAPNLPRIASNSRTTATAEESKAIVTGMLAHYGTYKVNEADGTFTVLPEGSSFPNWTGVEQPARKFAVRGDKLTILNPAPSAGGGVNELTLKRLK